MTLWQILTHNGSKGAKSRKDVFWGSEYLTFKYDTTGSQNVKTSPQIGNFKPQVWNMKV